MSIQIKLKNSVVQDSTPSASDLPEVGELAVNGNINSIGGFMRASDNTIVKIFGPGSVTTPTATTTVSGISELATNSETTTGTATNRVVTPAGLNAVTVAERTTSNNNYVAKAGSTMTGALLVTNGSTSANSISPSGDANTGFNFGTDTVNICTGGSNRLTVNSAGETVTTSNLLIDGDGIRLKLGDAQDFQLYHTGSTNKIESFVGDIELLAPTSKAVLFGINSAEKARIDSSGRLLVGHSSSLNVASSTGGLLQVSRTTADVHQSLNLFKADNAGSILAFGKSRSATIGSYTVVQDDDQLGVIRFAGADGTDLQSQAASISAEVDGTPGANDMPGRLVFSTTADGAASPTERLRIDSSGRVGIGTASPSFKFDVVGGTGRFLGTQNSGSKTCLILDNNGTGVTDAAIGFTSAGSSQKASIRAHVLGNGAMMFHTNDDTEKMRIDASGRLLLGTTTGASTDSGQGGTLTIANTNAGITLRSGTSNVGSIYFSDGTSGNDELRGLIQYNHSSNFLRFWTDASERMRIDSSGRVGIGTTSPATLLNLNVDTEANLGSGSEGIRLTSGSSNAQFVRLGSSYSNNSVTGPGTLLFSSNKLSLRCDNGNPITFHTGSTVAERMRIDSSGNVGIGTTSPSYKLEVSAETAISGDVRFLTGSRHKFIGGGSGNNLELGTYSSNNTARNIGLVIDSSGNVGIGTTSPSGKFDVTDGTTSISFNRTSNTPRIDFKGNSVSEICQIKAAESSGGGVLQLFTKTTGGTATERMRIDSSGNVGINDTSPTAELSVAATAPHIDIGAAGGTRMKIGYEGNNCFFGGTASTAMFIFKQNVDLESHPQASGTERMRIDSSGRVGIGTTSPDRTIHCHNSSNTTNVRAKFSNGTTGEGASDGFEIGINGSDPAQAVLVNYENSPMAFFTNASERMRISSNGAVGIGTTQNNGLLCVSQPTSTHTKAVRLAASTSSSLSNTTALFIDIHGFYSNNYNAFGLAFLNGDDGAGTARTAKAVQFINVSGSEVGSIQQNQNSTSFNTSSDYRLKENAVAISDGITRLKTLKPYRFNFKTDSSTILDGFFAHEVSSAVPEAISGTKDAVDKDNNPIHQGIDQSKLVPLLVAAVQELIGRVETLEAA